MKKVKTFSELKKELDELYNQPTSRAQREAIAASRQRYEQEAQELVEKYMAEEISIFKDTKLKLSI